MPYINKKVVTDEELSEEFQQLIRRSLWLNPELRHLEADLINDCWVEFLDEKKYARSGKEIVRLVNRVTKRGSRNERKFQHEPFDENLYIKKDSILYGQNQGSSSVEKSQKIKKNSKKFWRLNFESLEEVEEFLYEKFPNETEFLGTITNCHTGKFFGRYLQFMKYCPICRRRKPCLSIVEKETPSGNLSYFWNCFNTRTAKLGLKRSLPILFSLLEKNELEN